VEEVFAMSMRTPTVYIETSVFNFVFADDAPEGQRHTLALFEEIRQGRYKPYTSEYVIRELERAASPKREEMLALIDQYNVTILPTSEEAERLARMYVAEGIIPARYVDDSRHIAMASVYGLAFIVSFNFKHIVKRTTVLMTESINLREGYNRIGIYSPTEVIEHVE